MMPGFQSHIYYLCSGRGQRTYRARSNLSSTKDLLGPGLEGPKSDFHDAGDQKAEIGPLLGPGFERHIYTFLSGRGSKVKNGL